MTDTPSPGRALARRVALALFAFLVGLGGSVAAVRLSDGELEPPIEQGARLGPIDVNAYCRRAHGPTAIPVLVRRDADGWRCAIRNNGIFGTSNIDVDLGCTDQYGQVAHGDESNLTWPYLWQCVAGPSPDV